MSKPKPRVFLDSNVIFSGLYSPKGAPGIILEHFIKGNISVVVSQQVLEEVIRTIKEKLPDALPALRRLLVSIPPEVVADPEPGEINRWARKIPVADTAILAAAVAAQPDYLVTGDNHFIENPGITEDTGLHIVTPAQFLTFLERGETQ
ncbi:putative toxin-antitoxin system toxin component, PIN family [Chloroflexota bacterium]